MNYSRSFARSKASRRSTLLGGAASFSNGSLIAVALAGFAASAALTATASAQDVSGTNVIGYKSSVNIVDDPTVAGINSFAIGADAKTTSNNAIALGTNAEAGASSVSIGELASTSAGASSAVAIGQSAKTI